MREKSLLLSKLVLASYSIRQSKSSTKTTVYNLVPNRFQISATALEETKILVWHRDKLKLILTMSDPFLKTVLDHVVARDVVKKLTQVSAIPCTLPE